MYQKHRFLFRFFLALLLFGFNGIVASRIALESSQIVLLRTLLGSLSLLAFFSCPAIVSPSLAARAAYC